MFRKSTIAAAGTLALLGAMLGATAASAAPQAGCTGAACTVNGNVTVAAAITLSMPTVTFDDGSVLAGQSSPSPMSANPPPQFSANVISGDAHGYVLTAVAGADFTTGNHNTFPASGLTLFEPGTGNFNNNWSAGNGGTQYQLPEPGATPVQLAANNGVTPAGGDNTAYATQVTVPASAGAGQYTIPIQFAAIGG